MGIGEDLVSEAEGRLGRAAIQTRGMSRMLARSRRTPADQDTMPRSRRKAGDAVVAADESSRRSVLAAPGGADDAAAPRTTEGTMTIRKGLYTTAGGEYKMEYKPSGQASCGFGARWATAR
jgi:hypothetical protein